MIQQGTNCRLNVSNCTLGRKFPNKVMQIRNLVSGEAVYSASEEFLGLRQAKLWQTSLVVVVVPP